LNRKCETILVAAPCYLCGEPSVLDGLCKTCYELEHPLLKVTSPVSFLACKKCGAIKVPGGWKTLDYHGHEELRVLEQQIDMVLDREVKKLVPDVTFSIVEDNRLDRVVMVTLVATGRSAPSLEVHEETYPVEIRVSYGTCGSCGMMSGGYFESILQVRCDGRSLTPEEEEEIEQIVRERTIAEYGQDTKAFVLDVQTTKFGLDFWFGSDHLCRKVADEIEAKFLAERKENYKLHSQNRTGKEVYRTTILLRLPKFSIGDFLLVAGHPCQVLTFGKSGLGCFDLLDRNRFTITTKSAKWRTIEYIASADTRRQFMVVANVYGQPLQLMDMKTYDTVEYDFGDLQSSLESGMHVDGIVYEDGLYLLPFE
jgi:nonsense-mediated mRNA decay protein 3